ncbi:MAG: efflux RND transporter periplasmic adaptor subunit [Tannerella sp.]|jgi:RND family efflux transporter MFP subunit|nr:efflux RND transporter periplasmic adaptor subunit [Tannerella sp.]
MKSNKVFSILISVLLVTLIAVVLVTNMQEIDRKSQISLEMNVVVPVNVTQARWMEVNPSIVATGRIVAVNSLVIASKSQGTVVEKFRKTGDRVTKGTPIAKIEDRLIREDLRVAESNHAKAKKDMERYASLQKDGIVTKTETEAIELNLKSAEQRVFDLKEQLQNTLLIAPAAGVLENVMIEEGSLVTPGMAIAETVDPSRLKMEIFVTEKEVVRLKHGQQALVKSDVFADRTFEGTVSRISIQGDEAVSYKVEIDIPVSEDLKPGMFAEAEIKPVLTVVEKKRLVIDRHCIVGGLKEPKIYIVSENKARLRPIVIGNVSDDCVEILSGLTENEVVIFDGQINLTDKANVRVMNL